MGFITFIQNDDWVYYRMIQNFLRGDFMLDQFSAPTFYTQGLLGFLFASVFSIEALPYLTILISLAACGLLWLILVQFFGLTKKASALFAVLLLVNPLFAYSLWGFMTENYFIFFLLINFYLFYKFEKTQTPKDFVFLLCSIFISFMLRQVALTFLLALGFYYLMKKKYKLSQYSFMTFAGYYLFYLSIFPRTPEMLSKPLALLHLWDFNYAYAIVYGSLLYAVAFLLPLVISFFDVKLFKLNTKLLLFIVLALFGYFYLNSIFKPTTRSWGEFPYFENTWERMGFYPRGVIGTKYQFVGNFDLYLYWDLAAKILLVVFFSYVLVYYDKKRLVDFNVIFICVYLFVLLLAETFYDRYLLVLMPSLLFFFAKRLTFDYKAITFLVGFMLFMGFYCYQFSMDFILVNNYVWQKSKTLVVSDQIDPIMIHGTNAWKSIYPNLKKNYIYEFSYDSPIVNERYAQEFILVETHEIYYPFNFFINPKIYLYKKV